LRFVRSTAKGRWAITSVSIVPTVRRVFRAFLAAALWFAIAID